MATRHEYSEMVLELAGCTCHPRVIVQELDDKGSFMVKHEHTAECAKTLHAKKWKARSVGAVSPDTMTENDRRAARRAFLEANPRR